MRIALSGKMSTGKSTIARKFAKQKGYRVLSIGSEIKPLARDLIENRKRFEEKIAKVLPDAEKRNAVLDEIYLYYDKRFRNTQWIKNRLGNYIKTNDYRLLLQEFPMVIRYHLGNDVFLRLMLEREKAMIAHMKNIIVDDLRLPEEKELLESLGFITVRLDVSEEEQLRRIQRKYGSVDLSTLKHVTETALDHDHFDYRIDTTGQTDDSVFEELVSIVSKIEK
jgi:dephospho-CoA kinase